MASGDAQRVWFSEMLEELASVWSLEMDWAELADFCERMTLQRRAIRMARGIRPPRTRCRRCGKYSQSDIEGVSIRSALFALKKSGLLNEADFKVLDKRWKRHKAAHNLDPYGRPATSAAQVEGDGHGRCD